MKKIIILCTVLLITACSRSGEIQYSEYEHFKDVCNKNDGIALFYYQEIQPSNTFHSVDFIVGVKCNDGAVFKEEPDESLKRFEREELI